METENEILFLFPNGYVEVIETENGEERRSFFDDEDNAPTTRRTGFAN